MRFILNFMIGRWRGLYSVMDLLYSKLPFAEGIDSVRWVSNSDRGFGV